MLVPGKHTFTLLLLCVHYQSGMEICMLDVGQGRLPVLGTSGWNDVLVRWRQYQCIRCRNLSDCTILKARGVHKIDYLLISHMDQDHINGIKEMLEGWKHSGGAGTAAGTTEER